MTSKKNGYPKLPSNWALTDVGTLCDVQTGPFGTQLHKTDYATSGVQVIEIGDVRPTRNLGEGAAHFISKDKAEQLTRYEVRSDDILFTRVGTVGRCTKVPSDCTGWLMSTSLIRVRVRFQQLLPSFLLYYFWSPDAQSFAKTSSKGTTRAGTNSRIVAKLPLVLAPVNEQKRIVTKIEELFSFLDAGVESLRKVQAQLKRYRQAVLKYAFEGKLTEEWRKTHKHQTEPTTKLPKQVRQDDEEYVDLCSTNRLALNGLPENWSWKKIGDIADLISGQHIMKEDYNFDQSGLPYLTGPADFGSESPIVSKWTTKPKVVAKDGDVLVTVKGAGVGKVNILELKEAVISRQLMAIRARHARPKFVFRYVQYALDSIRKMGSGSTVPGIRREKLLELPLPFPSIAEQDQIVNEIENRMQVVVDVEKTLARSPRQAESLRQSILKHAFEGKLVHQDPSDEPAEKLLERVKAERAKAMGEKDTNRRRKNRSKQLELSTYVK